jgi:hypothetical protein
MVPKASYGFVDQAPERPLRRRYLLRTLIIETAIGSFVTSLAT